PEARIARERLIERYGDADPQDSDVVVALGGDGFMLETLHAALRLKKPIFGMNRGSVGFLLNDYAEEDLIARITAATSTVIHPLAMRAVTVEGAESACLAINEVS